MLHLSNEHYNNLRNKNKSVLDHYKDSMNTYIKTMYPNMSQIDIDSLLNDVIQENYYDRQINVVHQDDTTLEQTMRTGSLMEYTSEVKNNYLNTPSGASYHPSTTKPSIHTEYIVTKQKERSKVKKNLFKAEVENNNNAIEYYNTEQMNIKILINSISGVLNNNLFFSSRTAYNATTSTSRHGIMLGYGIVERLVSGNMYFTDINDVINYITRLLIQYPGDEAIDNIMNSKHLYQPDINDVLHYLLDSYEQYTFNISDTNKRYIEKYLNNLSNRQLSFVFYANSLYNIFTNNINVFKDWVNNIFITKQKIIDKYNQYTVNDINDTRTLHDIKDEDMFMLISSLCVDLLNYEPTDKLKDPVKIACIMEIHDFISSTINDNFTSIFDIFLNIDFLLHDVSNHNKMLRKTVVLSDTDSIIFTLQEMVGNMVDNLEINDKTIAINAIFIYLIFKHLHHVFTLFSIRCNIEIEKCRDIEIKNEYLYTSFIRSNISKHYLGSNLIREGNYLNPPKLDIKGLTYINSNLPTAVKQNFKKWIVELLSKIDTGKPIQMEEIINEILGVEQSIVDKLNSNDTTYLPTSSVKTKENYKQPMVSIYFHYLLYTEVFAEEYDQFVELPAKFSKLALGTKINYKNSENTLNILKKNNPKLYDRFVKFLSKHPKKNITYIILPITVEKVLPDIDYLINHNKVVNTLMRGYYLILNSLGFGFPNNTSDPKFTLMDFLK